MKFVHKFIETQRAERKLKFRTTSAPFSLCHKNTGR